MEENATEFDQNAEFDKYMDTFYSQDSVSPEQQKDDIEDNTRDEEKPVESDTSSPETFDSATEEKELPLNYQELYLKERQRAAAHAELLTSRLKDVAKQYQELKGKKETFAEPEEEESVDKLPNSVRDLFEIHPDIAEALKEYVNHRVKKSMSRMETAFDSKVKPLESQLHQTEAQRHDTTIRAAHPDVSAIMESGDLLVWMNSLDSVSRTGAMQIYQNGTANEIVDMLNVYKQHRGVSKARRKNELAKPVEKDTPAYDSYDNTSNTEDVVKRVMAAMNVPSSKPPMDIAANKPKKVFSPDDEFNRLVRNWEKQKF